MRSKAFTERYLASYSTTRRNADLSGQFTGLLSSCVRHRGKVSTAHGENYSCDSGSSKV